MPPLIGIGIMGIAGGYIGYAFTRSSGLLGTIIGAVLGVLIGIALYNIPVRKKKE